MAPSESHSERPPRPGRRKGRRSGSRPGSRGTGRPSRSGPGSLVGTEYEVEVGPVAHGGFCVARHEGRVVFVRHALPGERVRVRVTEGRPADRFLRADAVEVLDASPDRVVPPCPYAGPGRCGGCDWQHATLDAQRELKAAVLVEQLRRLAGLDRQPVVEAVPGATDGSGWRTRVRFAVDPTGRAGLRRHRSHDVEPLDACLIAAPAVNTSGVLSAAWPRGAEIAVTVPAAGTGDVVVSPVADQRVVETVDGREFSVPADGFWQVHPAAATVLTRAVTEALAPRPGETLLDLYAGSGLFAGMLAPSVAPGPVVAVESDAAAVAAARDNLADVPGARVIEAGVDAALLAEVGPADLVVLDPPRTGAGREVVDGVAALAPRRIAYVACDPAALARDLAYFAERGYALVGLRAFDLFPHTHHLEAVATLEPTAEQVT
ncbi:class I SAM-dependent RNA methyltransferase [Sporichthya polymorpha]|uniref:class I SAM-dependent RNA methyltransferase n=1 Tax=Sporichthya polymorpha TaxID=35751 RepID=UPI00039C0317|nr:TRAM domain-containing protein [Sporichthya polymorpha]